MNKKAYSLIELMIVLAIFGILFCIPAFQETFRQFNHQEEILQDQENVFLFTTHLRTLIKNSKYIDTAFDRQLIMDNLRLVVSKDKSRVFLNGKIWKFSRFTICDFERVDDQTAICNINNSGNKYCLYITPGKYGPVVDEVGQENSNAASESTANADVEEVSNENTDKEPENE